MVELEQALTKILEKTPSISATETVPLSSCYARVLADPIISPINLPPMDNSAMDGYCLRYVDLTHTTSTPETLVRLPVSQTIAAGYKALPLATNTAARIFTGATLPEGADTIVMQEDCQAESENDQSFVLLKQLPTRGAWVRKKGFDVSAGQVIFKSGQMLHAPQIALLASCGIPEAQVFKKIKVAIVSTGDELVNVGQSLSEGQIYNSNQIMLTHLVQALGAEVIEAKLHLADDLAQTSQAFALLAQNSDLIISSGGVSVGEYDFVKAALAQLGSIDLWKIAIKPGKPLLYGQIQRAPHNNPSIFIGLPGNPVSSLVTFLLVARAVLFKLQGRTDPPYHRLKTKSLTNWDKPAQRREFLRAVYDGQHIRILSNQDSSALYTSAQSNAIVDNPQSQVIRAGDEVYFYLFSELFNT